MRAEDCVVVWNDDDILVITKKEDRRDHYYRKHYRCSSNSYDVKRLKTKTSIIHYLCHEALRIILWYELDPKMVHNEFMKIDEYRENDPSLHINRPEYY